jgi:hypothetical protein
MPLLAPPPTIPNLLTHSAAGLHFQTVKDKDTPLTNQGMLKILGPEVEEVLDTMDSRCLIEALANDDKRRNPCP